MTVIRKEYDCDVVQRSFALTDDKTCKDPDEKYESEKQRILNDETLAEDEKLKEIKKLTKKCDYFKIISNVGTRRICENCHQECLATSYCEHCVRNHLIANFSNWTSGNVNVDDLIQKCQMGSLSPVDIVEWIPYDKLKYVEFFTKGGCSEIYSAFWVDGEYNEWDSKEKQLRRIGPEDVVLKTLKNVESANRSWFDEAKFHLNISYKCGRIVKCLGLTQNPTDKSYMLIMRKMDYDLRKYLLNNHNQITWNERVRIARDIIYALRRIHGEKAIHRDLHSGNVLHSPRSCNWYISDFGFCGPADKPLNCAYGNLPYMAPEVIVGEGYIKASDIYSVGMLMWEISSGQPPFIHYEHDYDLAMEIVNGMRPKIVPGTPLAYKELMEKCWVIDPSERPNVNVLLNEINNINSQNINDEQQINDDRFANSQLNISDNITSNSKIYTFEGLLEPKNVIRDYHSKQNDLSIPHTIVFDDQNNSITTTEDEGGDLTSQFKEMKLSDNKEQYARHIHDEIRFQHERRNHVASSDEDDEIYNNPNIHLEEQNDLEIPEEALD